MTETQRHDAPAEPLPCTPKRLPDHLLIPAAATATAIHPPNAPLLQQLPGVLDVDVLPPLAIAVMTQKYWGPKPRTLSVSFLDGGSVGLQTRILAHMNAWADRGCCIRFALTSSGGQVRIARIADGYWSYLGTDILHIGDGERTMNLQGFSEATPESEYRRVVRHETGHSLGFPHEHMRKELVERIDRQKAYAYFGQTQGWSPAEVDQQVLTPLDERTLTEAPTDQTSIMAYSMPGSITTDGQPIVGGIDINEMDATFAGKIYPSVAAPTPIPTPIPTPVPTPTPTGGEIVVREPQVTVDGRTALKTTIYTFR